jgi:hypothetical protein
VCVCVIVCFCVCVCVCVFMYVSMCMHACVLLFYEGNIRGHFVHIIVVNFMEGFVQI